MSTINPANSSWQPIIFDIKIDAQKEAFSNLIDSNTSLQVLDEIIGQLEELVKLKTTYLRVS